MSFNGEPPSPTIRFDGLYPVTPSAVDDFLSKYGWEKHYNQHPVSGDAMFTRYIDGQKFYCTWSEAVAYEFIRFVTLGGMQ